jgi:hypothetical protein
MNISKLRRPLDAGMLGLDPSALGMSSAFLRFVYCGLPTRTNEYGDGNLPETGNGRMELMSRTLPHICGRDWMTDISVMLYIITNLLVLNFCNSSLSRH